jgi:hypothetical protein
VSRLREMMQPDSQDVGPQFRDEIRLGIENLAQQGASIIVLTLKSP